MKKVLSVLLSLVMLFSITSVADFSAYALTSGEWQYSIVSGGVSITGYKGSETELTIPSKLGSLSATVVSIGENAFKDNAELQSVVIPDTVSALGKYVFSGCYKLKNVTLPDTITDIPQNAFCFCESLESIGLPANLKTIGSMAFAGCSVLKSIDISESVTSIGMMAFSACLSLSEFTLPAGLSAIHSGVFSGCENLKTVTIPNSVKTIMSIAFAECPALTDVYYLGTRDEWEKVSVDYTESQGFNNDSLLNATIHCIDDSKCLVTVLPSSLGTSTINNIDVIDDEVTIDVFENADVTLTATPDEGAAFVGWRVNDKIISNDAQITVKALADITYVPVFQEIEGAAFTVVFTDRYGNIFYTQDVTIGAEIDLDLVKAPIIAGYNFKGWSITPEEIAQLTESTIIKAVHEKNNSEGYTVTALGCSITALGETVTDTLENVPYDTLVTVYKQNNSAWSINGAVVAYGQSYSFYVGSDVTLTTWDGPVVLAPTVAAVSVTELKDGDKIKASFLATLSMTDDCTYVSSGFVYGKNLDDDYITLADVKENSAVKAYYASTNAQQFALTYSLAAQQGKMTARAFLAYVDANGATQVIYAKPQTYTYSA